MPAWSVGPFVLLLLAIAVLPLAAPHWWHSNRHKALVSLALGLPVGAFVAFRDPHALGHVALEYLAFIALLGSLFVISGGIRVVGTLPASPAANAGVLALGAVLANFVGTTGASMLLIRPFLRANRGRRSRTHLVVFFILVVANCGGCLTPLGDPPLFLGFLRNVPFTWTLRLWPAWLAVNAALVVVFFLVDRALAAREASPEPVVLDAPPTAEPLRLEGSLNFLLLAGVVGVVLLSGFVVHPRFGEAAALVSQSLAMAALAGLSMAITPAGVRKANEFSWHPLVEVAVLFVGIFLAMIPALDLLKANGDRLGVREPWQFFWATGALSAFLDNAPTYLAFLSTSQFLPDEVVGTTHAALAAISMGAVFFGAVTYIGNGPNFMVKAIAEEAGVPMPSFFGYLKWSLPILLPLFAVLSLVYFR
jgi:Na+/H+ antiporter NhaD/arsenite permease-like protein